MRTILNTNRSLRRGAGLRTSRTGLCRFSSPAVNMTTPQEIHFVTGNQKKLEEVVAILSSGAQLPFKVTAVKLDLPEFQGEPEYIARHKCKFAADKVGGAVMVEDTSLCFNALGGLPGPYIKCFLDKVGHSGLNKMLGPEQEPLTFIGQTQGQIVLPRGPTNFGWDPVFEPAGFAQTYAEMDKTIKNTISHRYRALDKLRSYLLHPTV